MRNHDDPQIRFQSRRPSAPPLASITALAATLLACGASWADAPSAGEVLHIGGGGGKDAAKAGNSTDGALLVDSFESLLKDRDVDAFRTRVATRYDEEALTRILASSPDVKARRAAALASGLSANFGASNAAVAKGLKDSDAAVRNLTENALWAIWFRASTPENNKAIQEVASLIGGRELDSAIDKATRLIEKAPDFAEAYNQRAIAHYLKDQFAESVDDCLKALARNPYHFGALTGMAGCYRLLDQPRKALGALRQAIRVRPHDESIAEAIKSLEESLGPATGKPNPAAVET